MQNVAVGLVEIDALLDDGFVVGVERQAARLERPRAPDVPRLGFEQVVAAVAVLVDQVPSE